MPDVPAGRAGLVQSQAGYCCGHRSDFACAQLRTGRPVSPRRSMSVIPEYSSQTASDSGIPRYKIGILLAIVFIAWFALISFRQGLHESGSLIVAIGSAILFCASCVVVGGFLAKPQSRSSVVL